MDSKEFKKRFNYKFAKNLPVFGCLFSIMASLIGFSQLFCICLLTSMFICSLLIFSIQKISDSMNAGGND